MTEPDLLSKEEVNALLDKAGDPNSAEVQVYDFASNDRIVRGKLPTLELINERFARQFRSSVIGLLRRSVEVTPAGVRLRKYEEYIHSLPVPCGLNLINISALPGTALVAFTPELVFNLVDCLFGGDGSCSGFQDDRELTPTELSIMELLLQSLIKDMQDAWSVLMPLEIKALDSETNPRFATIAAPLEPVLDCTFQIDFEQQSGTLHITFPYSMMEPIRHRLEDGTHSDRKGDDERWLNTISEEIAVARVNVTATVAAAKVTMRDLMALKPGDVIPIEMFQMATAYAEGIPLFRGTFGVHNSKYSIQFCSPIRPRAHSLREARGAQATGAPQAGANERG